MTEKDRQIVEQIKELFDAKELSKDAILKQLAKEHNKPQSYINYLWQSTYGDVETRVRTNRMRCRKGQQRYRDWKENRKDSDAFQSLPRQKGTVKYVTRNPKNISPDNPGYLWYDSEAEKIPYHNIVYCQAHGLTKIPDGHFVYHLDRDLGNNEPENLQLFTQGEFQEYMQQYLIPRAQSVAFEQPEEFARKEAAKKLFLEANGLTEIPDGYVIGYLDGDEDNVELSNMKLCSIIEAAQLRARRR